VAAVVWRDAVAARRRFQAAAATARSHSTPRDRSRVAPAVEGTHLEPAGAWPIVGARQEVQILAIQIESGREGIRQSVA
jgi:hypothetical protein